MNSKEVLTNKFQNTPIVLFGQENDRTFSCTAGHMGVSVTSVKVGSITGMPLPQLDYVNSGAWMYHFPWSISKLRGIENTSKCASFFWCSRLPLVFHSPDFWQNSWTATPSIEKKKTALTEKRTGIKRVATVRFMPLLHCLFRESSYVGFVPASSSD